MFDDLEGRRVLLTGSTSGIGLAVQTSTGSLAGRERGGAGSPVCAAAMGWPHGAQRSWVKVFTKDRARFHVVAPGSITTAFHADKDVNGGQICP